MRLHDVLPDINVQRVRVTNLDDRLKRMVTLTTAEEVLKYLDRRFIDRLRTASNREAEIRMVSDLLGGEPLTEKNIKISMNELRFLIREVIKNKLKL
jgi:hypothetical protein